MPASLHAIQCAKRISQDIGLDVEYSPAHLHLYLRFLFNTTFPALFYFRAVAMRARHNTWQCHFYWPHIALRQ